MVRTALFVLLAFICSEQAHASQCFPSVSDQVCNNVESQLLIADNVEDTSLLDTESWSFHVHSLLGWDGTRTATSVTLRFLGTNPVAAGTTLNFVRAGWLEQAVQQTLPYDQHTLNDSESLQDVLESFELDEKTGTVVSIYDGTSFPLEQLLDLGQRQECQSLMEAEFPLLTENLCYGCQEPHGNCEEPESSATGCTTTRGTNWLPLFFVAILGGYRRRLS